MSRALAVMLTRAIDYAGVFPPAKLDLASAFANYSRYASGPEAWILGKLIVRTTSLGELANLITAARPKEPMSISVVGRGGGDRTSWEVGLGADARDMNSFETIVGELASIDAYETRLPTNAAAAEWIRDLHGFSGVDVFTELGWDDHQADALAAAAESEFVYVKGRTGGEAVEAFPSPAALAAFIQGAVHLGVSFKLTAGLHHAFPVTDDALGVRMFGFIPTFAATACCLAHDLSVREMATILESGPEAFRFAPNALHVHNWEVGSDDLADARDAFIAFGSCSVDEPLETLRHAGLETP